MKYNVLNLFQKYISGHEIASQDSSRAQAIQGAEKVLGPKLNLILLDR